MDTNNLTSLLSGVMSNPEMMGKLQGILSNPEAMNSIKNAVSGIAGSEQSSKEETKEALSTNVSQRDEARNRAQLICALKPYLNEERRDKADKLLSLLNIIWASGMIGKQ